MKTLLHFLHNYSFRKSFALKDQILFAQRLSLLVDSGISLAEAMRILQNIETSKYRAKAYTILLSDIEEGISLSTSIRSTGVHFENTLVALIETGEGSGTLGACLREAHIYLEKKNDLKKKVGSSLVYPAFIVIATVAMTLFLILFIFPKIIPLLKSLNIELPLITRLVLGMYHFLISYGLWASLLILCLGMVFVVLLKKNVKVRWHVHSMFLHLPVIGNLIQMYVIAGTLSIGYILLSSGKSLSDMLAFSENSSSNLLYKNAYREVREECNRGVSFARALSHQGKLFPPLLVNMMMIGEKTGGLDTLMYHLSKLYEQEVENVLKKFSSLIEPLLMILMGLVVGSIALSIILPVYEVTNHLNQ